MKKILSFLILTTSFYCFGLNSVYAGVNLLLASEKEPVIMKPITPHPQPKSLVYVPVEVWVDDVELSVYFDYPVGMATISLTDEYGANVYYTLLDTDVTTGIDIPVETWSSGVYIITIQYGGKTYSGSIDL